jgi:hypothetical protein
MLTAYTNELPADVLLDSGVLFVGAVPFGVSRGGLKFDPKKTVKQLEFDGRRSDIAGNDRTTMFGGSINGKFIQFGAAQIATLEPDITSASASGVTTFTPKPGGVLYSPESYLTNLRVLYERSSSTVEAPLYAAVLFPKALCTKYSLVSKDKEELEIDCEFMPRLDMSVEGANLNDAPYKIELRSSNPT